MDIAVGGDCEVAELRQPADAEDVCQSSGVRPSAAFGCYVEAIEGDHETSGGSVLRQLDTRHQKVESVESKPHSLQAGGALGEAFERPQTAALWIVKTVVMSRPNLGIGIDHPMVMHDPVSFFHRGQRVFEDKMHGRSVSLGTL